MIKRLIQWPLHLLGLCAIAYVVLCVPLGKRTLFEHSLRIAHTDEAQDLAGEVQQAAERASQAAVDGIQNP